MSQSEWKRRGILCLVSGPSGSGKTTLCRRFSETDTDAVYAISATTRAPRGGEQDGIDYFFLSREKFEDRVRNGEFIEYAEVHGNLYGTLKSEVIARLEEGKDVLMDIDVQGAAHVRAQADPAIRDSLVDIFILPPNDEELLKVLELHNNVIWTQTQLHSDTSEPTASLESNAWFIVGHQRQA